MFAWRLPASGLQYGAELEWRLAARWAHYRYEDFVELTGEQQAAHVAAYRIQHYGEAVVAHDRARSQNSPPPARRNHR